MVSDEQRRNRNVLRYVLERIKPKSPEGGKRLFSKWVIVVRQAKKTIPGGEAIKT